RTSMMLAMFTLVIFTLVTGGTISGSFIRSLDDVERFGGGFDVRAVAAPVRPIGDLRSALRDSGELDVRDIEAVGTQSLVPIRARQVGCRTSPTTRSGASTGGSWPRRRTASPPPRRATTPTRRC